MFPSAFTGAFQIYKLLKRFFNPSLRFRQTPPSVHASILRCKLILPVIYPSSICHSDKHVTTREDASCVLMFRDSTLIVFSILSSLSLALLAGQPPAAVPRDRTCNCALDRRSAVAVRHGSPGDLLRHCRRTSLPSHLSLVFQGYYFRPRQHEHFLHPPFHSHTRHHRLIYLSHNNG
ncbi:hypothetical protein CC80DRAFT_89091 [Byssothecium circinans]|uniref:Uncharacterized protein n=1 Tax=Byssothecium circinans TaxID=147558 RepID=A0A6A5TR71_9PLEO|nr:hypothetical protein CC80DRAFT_89091 [Byssothecium circinans]